MSVPDVAAAIRTRLDDNWSATPIAWPNKPDVKPNPKAPWIRLTILPAFADFVGMAAVGNRRFRDEGIAIITVFVPEGEGDGQALTLAEAAAAIFRGVVADGVHYVGTIGETPQVRPGFNDNAGWFLVPVHVPWFADQFA